MFCRELSFQKGDIIFIRRQIDKNWYEGEHNAMVGIFPVNYVEVRTLNLLYPEGSWAYSLIIYPFLKLDNTIRWSATDESQSQRRQRSSQIQFCGSDTRRAILS